MEITNYERKPKNVKEYYLGGSVLRNEPKFNLVIPFSTRNVILLKRLGIKAKRFPVFKSEYSKFLESNTFGKVSVAGADFEHTESPTEFYQSSIREFEPTESPTEFDEEYYKKIVDRITQENFILSQTNYELVNQIDEFQIHLGDLKREIKQLNEKIDKLTRAKTSHFIFSQSWLDEDLEE